MAARIRKIQHDEGTRLKIKTSQLINRLTDHALGKLDLSPTQVRSIEVLLRKTLPDLSATEMTLHDKREVAEWSKQELTEFLADLRRAGRSGTAAPADSGREPDSVH